MNFVEMIQRQMELHHISKSELARRLNVNPTSVQGMLGRHTIQASKLLELSAIFKYNFFREIAETLPYEDPKPEKLGQNEKALLDQVNNLQMEVNILRQTLKDIVGSLSK